MQIIPVLDLKAGQIVRGMAGRRNEYRAIESRLCADAQPASVGRAFAERGLRQTYLADLDAITGGGRVAPAWSTYAELLALGLELWVDAGLTTGDQARGLANFRSDGRTLNGIVAGLESLADPQTLADMVRTVGTERLIFSLDLKQGVPLVQGCAWQGLSPLDIAKLALRAGVRRMIVLDLARVGVGQGVGTEPLCRQLACLDSELQIIAGGGVRGAADLDSLERAGCAAALVASALHDGRIGLPDPGESPTTNWARVFPETR